MGKKLDKDIIKPHCYICETYFTSPDERIEVKVLLSNMTASKIPLCKNCGFEKGKANKRMHELWALEQGLGNSSKEQQKAYLKSIKNLKIIKKVA